MQIDRSILKLLASDTRSDIIRALKARRKTMTELSTELSLSAATVSEQLDKLENGGLVRKVDEGRKWKYYELTRQSRELTRPEPQPMLVIIASLLVLLFVGAYFMTPGTAAAGAPVPTAESDDAQSIQATGPLMAVTNGTDSQMKTTGAWNDTNETELNVTD